jgi:hypothetical protein
MKDAQRHVTKNRKRSFFSCRSVGTHLAGISREIGRTLNQKSKRGESDGYWRPQKYKAQTQSSPPEQKLLTTQNPV